MDSKGGVLMKRYELGKLLGQGTFAKVYHGRNLQTGMSVAIKVIDKEKVLKVGMMSQIKREISVMKLVKHPNVVQLYEVMASKTKIYFVLEYVKGGELFDKLAKGRLKEDVARKYFQQLISAIDFCHTRGVYHRDLKPENLLLDEEGNLKVSDFGLSALAETKGHDGLLHTTCGTPAYVAPEVINRKGYDGAKTDIWSCGVVLFVLLAGYLPFRDSNLMEMYRKITKAEFKFPNWFPCEARKLVSKMLDPNPKTRISIDKIMENSWFKKGLDSKRQTIETKLECTQNLEKDSVFEPEDEDFGSLNTTQDMGKVDNLNAFDIISFSPGFDLSGLFKDNGEYEKEVRFVSKEPVTTIIFRLEEIAKISKLKVTKKDKGWLRMEGLEEGKRGILSIDFKIFEITPSFDLVEVKKLGGNRVEYRKIIECIRLALIDTIWSPLDFE